MSLIGAEYFIEIDSILTNREVLGSRVKTKRDGFGLMLELPSTPDQYNYTAIGAPSTIDASSPENPTEGYRSTPPSVAFTPTGQDSDVVQIHIVRVVVNIDSELSAETYDRTDINQERIVEHLFWQMWKQADEITREFIDAARSHGQPWVEMSDLFPRVLNLVRLIDITLEKSFGFQIGRALEPVRFFGDGQFIDSGTLNAISDQLARKEPRSIGEVLVSDAFHLTESDQRNSASQATLLAAMAVEIKTKETLRMLAGEGKKGLLNLLLDNPRDWSMAAHGLFNKAIPVLAENPMNTTHAEISRAVQKLFAARNQVAHKGAPIGKDDARQYARTAWKAIQFLRNLEDSTVRHATSSLPGN